MEEWLLSGVQPVDPSLDAYLVKRGFTQDLIHALGLGQWVPPQSVAPEQTFRKKYGGRGQALEGHLAIPLRCPRGSIIGLDTREVSTKRITGYRLPKSKWVPVWLHRPDAPQRLWKGGRAWVVEGLFDLAAIDRVIPYGDVVFATQRAALTRAHTRFLSRLCSGGVLLAYDNDESGKKGTVGWTDVESGRRYYGAVQNLKLAGVPNVEHCRYLGKDPGDVWLNQGEQGLLANFGRY